MEQAIFRPNWVSAPGETIKDFLNEKNISINDFSSSLDESARFVNLLLSGAIEIDENFAKKLETVIGINKDFLISREKLYREDLMHYEQRERLEKEWCKKIPYRDMVKFGWLEKNSPNSKDRVAQLLKFFDVSNVENWYKKYEQYLLVTSFRTSQTFDSMPESVVTWLRYGSIYSNKNNVKEWDAVKFKDSLTEIKKLSRYREPSHFLPKLKNICANSGVSLVIAQTPKGCNASGATFINDKNRAVLMMSFRFKSDDHFWFSFFHEVGHLLLHKNKQLVIEGLDKDTSIEEKEANEFSRRILIPDEYLDEFNKLSSVNWRNIVRFAKKLEVSPGIIIGQLQKKNKIRYNQLNKLKTRFDLSTVWDIV